MGDDVPKYGVFLPVTPLALGLETAGGVMTTWIPQNTALPEKKTKIVTTAIDNQEKIVFHVLQGQRIEAKLNQSLGKFSIEGLPAAPRGLPQIKVTFEVDEDGNRTISALDKASGKSGQLTISADIGHVTTQEKDRLSRNAERNRDDDRSFKKQVDDFIDYLFSDTKRVQSTKREKRIRKELTEELNESLYPILPYEPRSMPNSPPGP